MRLLDSKTLELKEFPDNAIPSYAILSHTWGSDEVSFQEMQRASANSRAGYTKIKLACAQAADDGLDYVWVDTCCIDKSSSAELSESINSMYRWYQKAQICYAFLADVSANEDLSAGESAFEKSRWFTRGWTLQELIAPSNLVFYSVDWDRVATKLELRDIISEITSIDVAALEGADPGCFSVAQRMSWASKRNTTRLEDVAYCLLGIFDVNMALLYGEGERSFIRLQEEIMKDSDDHSLFAWTAKGSDPRTCRGLLATSPAEFENAGGIVSYLDWGMTSIPYAMTNKGLRITLDLSMTDEQNVWIATLNCAASASSNITLGIFLKQLSSIGDQYGRVYPKKLLKLADGETPTKTETIHVRQKISVPGPENIDQEQAFLVRTDSLRRSIVGFFPSRIDTPAGPKDVSELKRKQPLLIPIPKRTNGWVAGLLFKHEDPEYRTRLHVMLGFTPDLGVSTSIIATIDKEDSNEIFTFCDPRDPSVLEYVVSGRNSGSFFAEDSSVDRRLHTKLGLQRKSGRKIYTVDIGMSDIR
jgi:hypothetical protein